MKLRIKGNSLRLRLTRTDLDTLIENGRVREAICFGDTPDACLAYTLEHRPDLACVTVQFRSQEIAVCLPSSAAQRLQTTEQVGIYEHLPLSSSSDLEVAIEKDFACLDRSDADNLDTFPHPKTASFC